MDIFDDFDSEGKGYLKHSQIQHAYKEIFNESGKTKLILKNISKNNNNCIFAY